jgi:hypothetical protein
VSELLPCPFCDGNSLDLQDAIRDEDDIIQSPAFVQCENCLACVQGDDLASAIEVWELRTQPAAEAQVSDEMVGIAQTAYQQSIGVGHNHMFSLRKALEAALSPKG